MGMEPYWDTPENLAKLPGIGKTFSSEIIKEMIKNGEVHARQIGESVQVKAIKHTNKGKPDSYSLHLKEPPTTVERRSSCH